MKTSDGLATFLVTGLFIGGVVFVMMLGHGEGISQSLPFAIAAGIVVGTIATYSSAKDMAKK